MTTNQGIRVNAVTACLLCGERGLPLYVGLRDQLFDVRGVWDYLRCPRCGFVWLSPLPILEDLHRIYSTYYTHLAEDGTGWRVSGLRKLKLALIASASGYSALADGWLWLQLGKMLSLIPPLREIRRRGIMYLDKHRKGRLLDVGCGNGKFLTLMQDAGWDVQGVEPDVEAATLVQERHEVPVFAGSLAEAAFPDAFFDAVTLNHVIEHVHDPIAVLRECHRVLKRGGNLVVVTPNIESLGHRIFRQSWLHLDPPRHLHLFTLTTLRASAERCGLRTKVIRTSGSGAYWAWEASQAIKRNTPLSMSNRTWGATTGGLLFQLGEEAMRLFHKNIGEELLLIATVGSDV